MKKILLVILMFTFINNTYAEECTEVKIKELQQQAEAITIDTEFDEESLEDHEYINNIITIQGLNEEFYISSPNKAYLFEFKDIIDGKIVRTIESDIKKLYIYNKNCPGKILKEVSLSLKTYNPYSEFEECKGLEDELDICNKFYDGILDDKKFYEKIDEYNKKNNVVERIKKDNNTIYLVIFGIVILIIIGIFLLIRRNKKNILD